MARVNLEQRLFAEGRLHHLASLIGSTTHEAIGILAYLWHDSQELGKNAATAREIVIWCRWKEVELDRYYANSENELKAEQLISALKESGYIENIDETLYAIRGNEKQIQSLDHYRGEEHKRVSSLGGRARAQNATRDSHGHFKSSRENGASQPVGEETPNEIPAIQPNDQPGVASENPAVTSRNSIQSNSIQIKNPEFDFDSLYQLYPKKVGKQDGLRECGKQIKTPDDFAELKAAVERYREYVTRTPVNGEFIPAPKDFSTFMRHGRWRDCLEPDFGNVDKASAQEKFLDFGEAK